MSIWSEGIPQKDRLQHMIVADKSESLKVSILSKKLAIEYKQASSNNQNWDCIKGMLQAPVRNHLVFISFQTRKVQIKEPTLNL